jgi:hypothetical protein
MNFLCYTGTEFLAMARGAAPEALAATTEEKERAAGAPAATE